MGTTMQTSETKTLDLRGRQKDPANQIGTVDLTEYGPSGLRVKYDGFIGDSAQVTGGKAEVAQALAVAGYEVTVARFENGRQVRVEAGSEAFSVWAPLEGGILCKCFELGQALEVAAGLAAPDDGINLADDDDADRLGWLVSLVRQRRGLQELIGLVADIGDERLTLVTEAVRASILHEDEG